MIGQRREGRREDDARAGDHAAGDGQADQEPGVGSRCLGLLPHPGHQEDGVVDAERDQEDERVERGGGVGAREAEDVVEHERRDPEGRARTRRRWRATSSSGRDQRAQQQHQHHEDDHAGSPG